MILHFDLDSFFVSVERLLDPTLIGKPVIVGGTSMRGVVSSCSYEARKYGVHSAMSIVQARKICPGGIFIGGHMSEYARYSKMVTDIIAERAPKFEKASIDEFYIDVTGMDRFFNTLQWCKELRATIIQQTGLPISFGLASNKMLAKMCTNAAKPNGEFYLPVGKEQDFLDPQPVGNIPFCGDKTVEFLHKKKVFTIYDLRQYELQALQNWMGEMGTLLYNRARGQGSINITSSREAKSLSSERTFHTDTNNVEWLDSVIISLGEALAYDLRSCNQLTSCVAIKLRYSDFTTTTKQRTIATTSSTKLLIKELLNLFHNHFDHKRKVRLIGVRFSSLSKNIYQTDLFDNTAEQALLYKAVDSIKDKYGKKKIFLARNIGMNSLKNNDPRSSATKMDKDQNK